MTKKKKEKIKDKVEAVDKIIIEENDKLFLPKEWGRMKAINIYIIANVESLKNEIMTETEFEELLKKTKNIKSSY